MKFYAACKSFMRSKFVPAILVPALCFSLAACGAKEEETQPDELAGIPNPVVEYGTLAEINEKIGVNLLKPSVDGVTDERFSVISDEIAQYVCEINGIEWTFRAACVTDEDISGLYSEYNEFVPAQDAVIHTNEFYLDRFFDGGIQYTVAVTDPIGEDGEVFIDEDEFTAVCAELEAIQKQHTDDPLVGDYQETTGSTAACVERIGDVYNVTVNWTDAADVYHCHTMFDAVNEGDKLTYRGEEIQQCTYDEDGNETSNDVTESNDLGFFEIKDGVLYWTGAGQEECRSWVFEKIIYED